LVKERLVTLSDAISQLDIFLLEQLNPYDIKLLIPKKSTAGEAVGALKEVLPVLECSDFSHDSIETALRNLVDKLEIKAGKLFQPIRVAVCGRTAAPPLFTTLEAIGKPTALKRIQDAIEKLEAI